jgi:cobaltochelatase CobN
VGKIKSSLIKDGLHIFGQVPEGARYKNMLRALVRLKNDQVPALQEALALAKGYDYEKLLSDSTYTWENGQTSLMLLDELTELGRQLVDELERNEFREEAITQVIQAIFPEKQGGRDFAKLRTCLQFICSDLKPRLDATGLIW